MSKKKEVITVPNSFYCPITHDIMVDPVIDPEGHSYERSAITLWLNQSNVSPITRSKLQINQLLPNRALKDSIEMIKIEIKKKNLEVKREEIVSEIVKKKMKNVGIVRMVERKYKGMVNVKLIAEEGNGNRGNVDIVLVIDVSKSMDTEAKLKNEKGVTETFGLSLLDVVKHAVKTIIMNLDDCDRLGLVAFSTKAKIVFGLRKMDRNGREKSIRDVDNLHSDGQTNLWDGLFRGMEILRTEGVSALTGTPSNSAVLLLTDGLPNIVPPRGHLPMLKRYKRKYKDFDCIINTFGFGYSLDSALLDELSVEGNGMYAFIPDSSFVGTVFVNTLSNLLSTMATHVKVNIKGKIKKVLGDVKNEKKGYGYSINIGSIMYGQTKDIVLDIVDDGSECSVEIDYKHISNDKPIRTVKTMVFQNSNDTSVLVEQFRLLAIEAITQAMKVVNKDVKYAQKIIDDLVGKIRSSPIANDKFIVELLKDLTGQVTEAISRLDWYDKWGKHYLPSLRRAHSLQQCNNFKDPGIQFYGGKLFESIRDKADDVFNSLPPPKPSIKRTTTSSSSGSSYGRSSAVRMSRFNNCYNPCFHGKCKVLMGDGSYKTVGSLKKGDYVKCPNNVNGRIVCVLKTLCSNNKSFLVRIGELLITPYHPVKIHSKWTFPKNINPVYELDCEAVYSFILDKGHIMYIEGIQCVSLGHGFRENVVSHPYFGTNIIIEDLKKFNGWNNGLITCRSQCLIKNKTSNLVCGFKTQHIIL